MKTDKLQEFILKSLLDFKNNKEENILETSLSYTEQLRLSALIASRIPSNPDIIIDSITRQLKDFYDLEDYKILIKSNIKFLLKQYLVNKITPEQQLLLIFYVMLDYKIDTKKSFTLEFKNIQDYFESYILYNTEQLTQQIAEDKVQAITRENGVYFIRFTSNNTMVPTIGTKENFTNYLYNIN